MVVTGRAAVELLCCSPPSSSFTPCAACSEAWPAIRRAGSTRQTVVTVYERVFVVVRLFRALLANTVLRDEEYTRVFRSSLVRGQLDYSYV